MYIYSVTETRDRFNDVIEQLKEGNEIHITDKGKPFAILTPINSKKNEFAERMNQLEKSGFLLKADKPIGDFLESIPTKKKPGALKRFLRER